VTAPPRTATLTEDQRYALEVCARIQRQSLEVEGVVSLRVKEARALGIGWLTIANAMGVSRGRVQRLAR
jgi:hypothetical protein